MTRSNVMVRDTELLDVYHDHESDREHAVVVTIGHAGEIRVPEMQPSTIGVSGYTTALRDDERGRGGHFVVALNNETVAEGRLDSRTGAAVTAEIGGSIIEVPPDQYIEIDVYGEEVED